NEQLASRVATAEDEFNERMRELAERPGHLLADASVLRLFAAARGAEGVSTTPSPVAAERRAAPSATVDWTAAPKALNDKAALRAALSAAAKAVGSSPLIAERLHASFAAGLAPLVAGPGALAALSAYATACCGGRLLVLSATPALLEPIDLFGAHQGLRAEYGATPLAAALDAARACDAMCLVVIEGANRGPL